MEVPQIRLNNGVMIPCIGNGPGFIGMGLNKKKHNIFARAYRKYIDIPRKRKDYVDAIANSLKIGFTLLDYSSSYGDGRAIHEAIQQAGVDRNSLFLTTRISNEAQRTHKVRECLMQQLDGMGTDYIDLLMFHWPVTDLYLDTWDEMVKLYKEGYVRCLGVANCHQHHLEALIIQMYVL